MGAPDPGHIQLRQLLDEVRIGVHLPVGQDHLDPGTGQGRGHGETRTTGTDHHDARHGFPLRPTSLSCTIRMAPPRGSVQNGHSTGWSPMKEDILQSVLTGQRRAVTYVQSILGLKSGHLEAKEVLTRFEDQYGQMVAVGSLLEDGNLPYESRIELDLLCLGSVFQALAENPITDHLIFINLHPTTMESPDFWNRIQPWLWNLSIPPHRIVLEITEAYTLHDLDRLQNFARCLRGMELRIAVDDLGSGAASLSHMARLTPDFIKVDRSLVHQVHRRPYQAALLNALAVFAERMGTGYIAEGIESPEELQTVIDAEVPWGQGYILGEPTPLKLVPDTLPGA